MIQELLEKYGVFVLVLAYLVINVYLRNLKVLVLFLVTFIGFYQTVTNKTYALVIAYLVSISFSIVKNFHLLENFNGVPKIPSSFSELNGTLNGKLNGKLNGFCYACAKPRTRGPALGKHYVKGILRNYSQPDGHPSDIAVVAVASVMDVVRAEVVTFNAKGVVAPC